MESSMKVRAQVYRHHDLRCLIAPQRLAIVGAGTGAASFGGLTLRNCRGFAGQSYLVNPRRDRIEDKPCFPSLSALPEVPDCAVLTVPRDSVEPLVEEAARLGIGAVVVYAAGFAETGRPEWIALQRRLTALAGEAGIRILGPNTAGLVNHVTRMALTFTPDYAFSNPDSASIAIVSQSGGIANGLTQSLHRGVGLSHMLTTGNACDVDVADMVAYLVDDPDCRAIALSFEGLQSPDRLAQAGHLAWQADKPLIVFKGAQSSFGAEAATSHSGYLAGTRQTYDALFEEIGAIQVDSHEALVETARFFAKAGRPAGRGLAVLANSGGAAIIAADEAEAAGVTLPQPAPETGRAIAAAVPDFGAVRNPCDVTAQVLTDHAMLRTCAEALCADDAYGAILWPYLFVREAVAVRRETLSECARAAGKILVFVWMSDWLEGPGAIAAEQDRGTAVFRSMRRAMQAIAAWQAREARRNTLPEARSRLSPPDAPVAAARLLDRAAGRIMAESEAKRVFALYGVPVVQEQLVHSAAEAADVAAAIGFPVALKVDSDDLPHKTEAGAVRLGLGDPAAVAAGFEAVLAAANAFRPGLAVNGVLVQAMAPEGVEIMVGGRVDPLFGPLVVVSAGGILVELLDDAVTARAPVGRARARAMLSALRAGRLLGGVRGRPAVDREALAEVIARLSEFIADHAAAVAEFDVNPVICGPAGPVAVDGLITLAVPRNQGDAT